MTEETPENRLEGLGSEVPSSYEPESRSSPTGEVSPTQGPMDWDHVDLRPNWAEDVPSDAEADADGAPRESQLEHQSSESHRDQGFDSGQLENLDPRTLAFIQANFRNDSHLHLPVQMPDPAALTRLRRADPKMHEVWVKAVQKRIDHDMWMERAPFELPYKLARRGQSAAILGLVVVAALCGYAIYLDHVWVAAFLGAIDLVGIVAAFQGSTESSPPAHSDEGGSHRA